MNANADRIDPLLRQEADGLLREKGLHSLLGQYGEVHVTGSYALKLMAWRDLDIYLVSPNMAPRRFFELGGRVAELLNPAKMNFRNERIAKSCRANRLGRA